MASLCKGSDIVYTQIVCTPIVSVDGMIVKCVKEIRNCNEGQIL